MRDILVTENIAGPEMDALKHAFAVAYEPDLWRSADKLHRMIPDFRAVLVRNQTQVTAKLIATARHLQIIGRAGVGLDNIDTQAAAESGVVVAYTPAENSISVAELTMGLMLSLARLIPAADHRARSGKWERQKFTGTELFNKTLGIVGLGRIGLLVAQRAAAFGMKVLAHDAVLTSDSPALREAQARLASLDELLAAADIVTCHIPHTSATTHLFNYQQFSRMKRNALFINTSRGEIIHEDSLIRALREKKIAGAALDVRDHEPPTAGPLNDMPNVILTPHIAAFTQEGQQRVVSSICRDVAAVLRGEAAENFFNFPKPRRA